MNHNFNCAKRNEFTEGVRMLFSSITDNQLIYKMNDHTIAINGKSISFCNRIYGLAMSNRMVVILLYEVEKDGAICVDNLPGNNICAYNYEGNHLWNIWDIIKGIALPEEEDFPFYPFSIHTKHSLETAEYPFLNTGKLMDSHEYLCCHNSGGIRYILDITDRMVVDRQGFRF